MLTVIATLNGDWLRDHMTGQTIYLTGINALAQMVGCAVSMLLGSWFADPTIGVDWLGLLGGPKNIDPSKRIRNAVINAVLAVPYVLDVTNVSMSTVDKKLLISLTANTTEGLLKTEIPILMPPGVQGF